MPPHLHFLLCSRKIIWYRNAARQTRYWTHQPYLVVFSYCRRYAILSCRLPPLLVQFSTAGGTDDRRNVNHLRRSRARLPRSWMDALAHTTPTVCSVYPYVVGDRDDLVPWVWYYRRCREHSGGSGLSVGWQLFVPGSASSCGFGWFNMFPP